MKMKRQAMIALVLAAGTSVPAVAQLTGPSTGQSSYMVPSNPSTGTKFISIASNGDNVKLPDETFVRLNTGANNYRLVGLPDGMGVIQTAQDIIDGTITVSCNHENVGDSGFVRDHGNRGSFVSHWRVKADPTKPDFLSIVGGRDGATESWLYDMGMNAYKMYNTANPMLAYVNNVYGGPNPDKNGFGRFCSGDVAPPSAYRFGALGTDARIHLAGEEIGAPGRLVAWILTGPQAYTAWELPQHGDYSWENAVACPHSQAKTIVVGFDDSTPGNIYVWVGDKKSSGNEIDKAGLTDGKLYFMTMEDVTKVGIQSVEDPVFILGNAQSGPVESKAFKLVETGNAINLTGAQLQNFDQQNQMNFNRPEDGAWDPTKANRLFFVTTASFSNPSRLWSMEFNDIANPDLGGTITMLADGNNVGSLSGGLVSATGANDVKMMDNICTTAYGDVLIQEDVGNNPRLGRMWLYRTTEDQMVEVGISDADRFLSGGSKFLTQDEETSGIIDARDTMGPGWFTMNMQGHTSLGGGEVIEVGQLIATYIPETLCYADCDNNTQLSIDDFICFQTNFALSDPSADCDGDGQLSIDDFICFQTFFAIGC